MAIRESPTVSHSPRANSGDSCAPRRSVAQVPEPAVVAIRDPVDLAGALAVFYWLALGALASEDGEGFEAARKRAMRAYDDHGHLLGGAPAGGIARIRTRSYTADDPFLRASVERIERDARFDRWRVRRADCDGGGDGRHLEHDEERRSRRDDDLAGRESRERDDHARERTAHAELACL